KHLVLHGIIQRDEFHKVLPSRSEIKSLLTPAQVHPFEHPIPFIGIEGGRSGRLRTFQDAYRFIGQALHTSHPGHPSEPGMGTKPGALSGPPDGSTTSPYIGDLPTHDLRKKMSTQEMNSWLYSLTPDYTSRRFGSGE